MKKSAFILAGEPSADRLGCHLMQACDARFGTMAWFGIGGVSMQQRGLDPIAAMEPLSLIGLVDSLKSFRTLSALCDRLIDEVVTRQPDFVITIDAKAFSVRFAKRLKKRLRHSAYRPVLLHMVAPTIWAWGAWRARQFEQVFDVILCLFPSEPSYFDPQKTKAIFVGHPDAFTPPRRRMSNKKSIQILLLPGSRQSEFLAHLPLLFELVRQLPDAQHGQKLIFTLETLPPFREQILEQMQQAGLAQNIKLTSQGVQEAFRTAHFTIAASGTVTLEAALAALPGIVIYDLSWLNRIFIKLFYKQPTPVLPDIILGKQHFPFLISPHLSVPPLMRLCLHELSHLSERQSDMSKASRQLRTLLKADQKQFTDALISALDQIEVRSKFGY